MVEHGMVVAIHLVRIIFPSLQHILLKIMPGWSKPKFKNQIIAMSCWKVHVIEPSLLSATEESPWLVKTIQCTVQSDKLQIL